MKKDEVKKFFSKIIKEKKFSSTKTGGRTKFASIKYNKKMKVPADDAHSPGVFI